MPHALTAAADAILARSISGSPRVPGVVAMATDRSANIYEGAAGSRTMGQDAPMTLDSVFAIFSTSKAITATAVLQLAEEGKLDLDLPARHYVPMLGDIGVLDGFDDDGRPKTRAPKREITTRMLLLHTAGFGYDFFNQHYFHLVHVAKTHPSVISATLASIKTPLLFDPGQEWEYGSNLDWAGQVVEHVAGKRLGDFMQDRIFGPLGMHDTAFTMTPQMQARCSAMHQRGEDGGLTPNGFVLPQTPEIQMGGHGLHATVGDYMKFIRMWLNDGAGESGRILKAETVSMAAQNGLGALKIKALPNPIPALSNPAEFFPGMPKSWALSFMVNDTPAPTGRPAGALAWAGLANLYYWIDRQTGIGGFWATQILPFADVASVSGYLEFETAVYSSVLARNSA